MKHVQERLGTFEKLLGEHPLPVCLQRMAGELDALVAYARLAPHVDASMREELIWTADLARDTWALVQSDRSASAATDRNKAARAYNLLGALLDRLQDIMAARPASLSDYLLDAMSIIAPFVGSTQQVKGTELAHHGAGASAQARLEEVLWHHFTAGREETGREKTDPEAAWAVIQKKRPVIERVRDLVFDRTPDPTARAATLVLLYLSVIVSSVERLKRRAAGRAAVETTDRAPGSLPAGRSAEPPTKSVP
jgi:hypothetical protein